MRNVRIFNSVIAVGGVLLQVGGAFGQGQIAAWGGSLGPPPGGFTIGFKKVVGGTFHSVGLLRDGTVSCQGSGDAAKPPAGLSSVLSIDAGYSHSVALTVGGVVACWGSNADGQCNVPSDAGPASMVAAGPAQTMTLRNDGTVRVWGAGTSGETSVPSGLSGVVWIDMGTAQTGSASHCLAIKGDGKLVGWGKNESGQCTPPADLPAAKAVAGGDAHTVALLRDGTLRMWGNPQFGVLVGVVNNYDFHEIAVSGWNNVALRGDGTVACWGYGLLDPSPAMAVTGVKSVGVSRSSTFLLKGDGSVESFGGNYYGEQPRAVRVSDVRAVAAGDSHAIALRANGTVFGWGGNLAGESTPPAGLASVIAISAGPQRSVALTSAGVVVCWGAAPAPPPGLGLVASVAAGGNHIVAGLRDGTVACWGSGYDGSASPPAGISGVREVFAGYNTSFAVRTDGSVIGWGNNTWGQCLGITSGGQYILGTPMGQLIQIRGQELRAVRKVDAASSNVIACTQQGTMVVWGMSSSLVWGAPAVSDAIDVGCGNNHLAVLRSDGSVLAWGANNWGQINVPAGLIGASSLETCTSFTNFVVLNAADSSCGGSESAGTANLASSGGIWGNASSWSWPSGGVRVPGAAASVNLGSYGSVGADCGAKAGSLQMSGGASLVLAPASTTAGNDYSIRVTNVANLAGRLWLLGVAGAGSTLPENLNIPVLSAGTVNGNFDLIQSELPPPPGFFLTLVPEDVNGRTVFSLRLLPLPGGGELTASSTGTFGGKAVAAETIDINHDGFDDLALAVDFGVAQPGLIQILLNDGAGGLGSTSVLTSIPPQPTCLAVGDVDGDGDRDVAVGISSDSTARVYLDNGAGGLTASSVFSSASGTPISIAIVEPSGASLMAASGFVAVGTSGSKLRIYRDSSLQQEITLAGAPGALRPGKTDVIRPTGINTGGTRTASIDGLLPVAETGFMQTLTLAPSGLFEIRQTFFLTAKPVAMDVADLDGDGLDDIVTTNTDPVLPATGSALPVLSIFRNSGGTFGGGVPYQPATASSGLDVSLIDVDNDGDRDIVSVYKRVGSDSEAALLRVDTLGPGTPISIGQTTVLDASDPILSARGNLDGSGGEDLFLVNQPSGAFLTGTQEVKPFLATGGLKQGDLDGDGTVGASDIALLLLDFGPCPGCASDLDGSGEVDAGDLSFLLLLFD